MQNFQIGKELKNATKKRKKFTLRKSEIAFLYKGARKAKQSKNAFLMSVIEKGINNYAKENLFFQGLI